MPLYDYCCPACGTFALFRSIEHRNRPAKCPDCQNTAQREITVPNFALMSAQRREAHARNEKSQHEPRVGGAHRCASGCGCGSTKVKKNRQVVRPKLGRLEAPKRGNRPWMLGH